MDANIRGDAKQETIVIRLCRADLGPHSRCCQSRRNPHCVRALKSPTCPKNLVGGSHGRCRRRQRARDRHPKCCWAGRRWSCAARPSCSPACHAARWPASRESERAVRRGAQAGFKRTLQEHTKASSNPHTPTGSCPGNLEKHTGEGASGPTQHHSGFRHMGGLITLRSTPVSRCPMSRL